MVMLFEMSSVCYSLAMPVIFILINQAVLATDVSLLSSDIDDVLSTGQHCIGRDPAMDPFYEVRHGQDVVWQIPKDPKAVLFMGHAMNKDPQGYFDRAPNCLQCYGLPENRATVLAGLNKSYAIISVRSVESNWDTVDDWPPQPSIDRSTVAIIIKEWTKEHSLDHLPLAASGYSNGGNFTSQLTLDLDIKSLIIMCAAGQPKLFEHANVTVFPPTLYLGIPGGIESIYTGAIYSRNILSSLGVRTEMIDVLPRPISASNFTEKIPCMLQVNFTEKIPCMLQVMSEQIYEALRAESWLDDNDYLLQNPSDEDYEAVLRKYDILPFCKKENDLCFANHIYQELQVGKAFHSYTSEFDDEIFNWLDDTLFVSSSEPSRLSASQ